MGVGLKSRKEIGAGKRVSGGGRGRGGGDEEFKLVLITRRKFSIFVFNSIRHRAANFVDCTQKLHTEFTSIPVIPCGCWEGGKAEGRLPNQYHPC